MRLRPGGPEIEAPSDVVRDVAAFTGLAFAWTWTFWGGAIATRGELTSLPAYPLFLVGGLGPAVAAAVAVRRDAVEDPRAFWRRLVDVGRIRPAWWAAIAALASAPFVLGRPFGDASTASGPLAVGLLVAAVGAGLAEEPGWRGYALDRLARRWRWSTAALAVGAAWALWHLPLFFIDGTYHRDELGLASGAAGQYAASVVLLSLVYAAVYRGTGRSIAAVVALHALQNVAGELVSVPGAEGAELAVTAVLAAGAAWWLERSARP